MNLVGYFFYRMWQVGIDHVLPLVALLLLGMLVPRLGRLAIRVLESRLDEGEESTKARLALGGALVYVLQAVAYFLLVLAALSNVGVPALGAAIPATVVSAALGFGAQKIIGDFLAGFFILSEKQFGVGDYVSFEGTTGVEGTVVALTLRTTKVRTPTGEVVMVPNGSAGVITNFSQDWSRAVVDLSVPLHEGETLEEITSQVRTISQQAIKDPAIAGDVAGELEILSATGIVEPTVAGQPWQVKYRVLVQVNPSRQWAVERAIRSALLSAFWDHYNLPGNAAGVFPAGLSSSAEKPGIERSPETAAEKGLGAAVAASASADGVAARASAHNADNDDTSLEEVAKAKDHGPGKPASADAEEKEKSATGIWRTDTPSSKFQYVWTAGGRVRSSTTTLLAALAITGLLIFASWNPEDAGSGWLNPAYWSQRDAATSEAPAPVAPGEEAASSAETPPAAGTTTPTEAAEPTTSAESSADYGSSEDGSSEEGSRADSHSGSSGADSDAATTAPAETATQSAVPSAEPTAAEESAAAGGSDGA